MTQGAIRKAKTQALHERTEVLLEEADIADRSLKMFRRRRNRVWLEIQQIKLELRRRRPKP